MACFTCIKIKYISQLICDHKELYAVSEMRFFHRMAFQKEEWVDWEENSNQRICLPKRVFQEKKELDAENEMILNTIEFYIDCAMILRDKTEISNSIYASEDISFFQTSRQKD